MKIKILVYLSTLFLFILFSGCGSKRVARLESDVEIDLSGRWNETDSRLVAEALIEQVMEDGWYREFRRSHKRNPVVVVGHVRNRTYEHIDVMTFIKNLERAMLNSGEIGLVASADEREQIRKERADMQQWASIESAKDFKQEYGADFMLSGVLNSILDEEGGKRVVYYQADLNLTDLQTNRIIWTGQHSIKKYIERPLFSF
ncbi:MAG: penicillin-binding protein activator LpoB [Elusimicrobiota bacterium]